MNYINLNRMIIKDTFRNMLRFSDTQGIVELGPIIELICNILDNNNFVAGKMTQQREFVFRFDSFTDSEAFGC